MRLFSIFAVALLATAAVAQAQARSRFDLPPQPLADSLRAVGSQGNINVLFDPPLVADHQAPALKGEYTSSQAFTLLLVGTGIRYEFMNDHTVVLAESTATSGSAAPGTGERKALPSGKSEGGEGVSSFSSSGDSSRPSPRERGGAEGEGATFWGRFRVAQAEAGLPQQTSERSTESPSAAVRIEEVVVTAQKREERLQDVPISISVLGGAELDQSTVQGITEALNRVPGVSTTVTHQAGGTQIAIRGVTAGGTNFNGSSPVSYYLDSVPFGFVKSAIAPDVNAYDLARVEVLRGPQGTLYGASAQNGVVRVLTHDADLDKIELKARTSASGTKTGSESYRGDMAVNVPIVPGRLAARAVIGYQNLGGWIDLPDETDTNDAEIRNLRFKVNAQPTDQLSIGLSAWFSRADYGAPSVSDDNGRRLLDTQFDEPGSMDYDSFGLKMGYEFSDFSVSSMTSYLDFESRGNLDLVVQGAPNTNFFTGFNSRILSQEVILNSELSGPWKWSVGGMYRDAEDRLYQLLPGLLPAPIGLADGSESYAVFGELSRRFLEEKMEWTLGLRYFHDDVLNRQTVQHQGLPDVPLLRQDASSSATSPRAVLTWRPTSALTVYGSYSEGFRSGFPQNSGIVPADLFPPLAPDTLSNYEIGAKADLLNGQVSIDTALYYIRWEDVQQTVTVPFNGVAVTALVNGDSASGMGFDFGLRTRPLDGLELGVTLSWNDLRMDTDVFNGPVILFAKGDRLNFSPEYTVGASVDYSFPLGSLEGRFSLSGNYTSEQDRRGIFGGRQRIGLGDPISIARTSFSIETPNWSTTVFADNITDEEGSPSRDPRGILDWQMRVRPRTIGVQLDYRFGR